MLAVETRTGAEADTALLECPFCGAPAAFEAHPADGEIVRVACTGEPCAVRPATEYLLDEYRGDLVRAWNIRAT